MRNLRELSRPSLVFGKYGFCGGELHDAQDIAVGKNVYVTDSILGAVSIYDIKGVFLRRVPKTRFDKDESVFMKELRNEINGSTLSGYSGSWPNLLRRAKSMPGYLTVCDQVCEPFGITVDELNRVYFTDRQNNQVYVSDEDCSVIQSLLTSEMSSFLRLRHLGGIAVHRGKIFCVDTESCRVIILHEDGSFIGEFGHEGDLSGEFCHPVHTCIDHVRERLIISDTLNSRVQVVTLSGRHLFTLGWQRGDQGELHEPSGVGVDHHGNIYVADTQLHRIYIYSKNGDFLQSLGDYGKGVGLFRSPRGLSVTPEGAVFVVDHTNCRIQVF